MKKYYSLIFLVVLLGCTFNREINIRMQGDNIKSQYGKGDMDVNIQTKTSFCSGKDCK